MVSLISQRSVNHNNCEDNAFFFETDQRIYGAVFDGCSRGINSHFASQLMSYSFQQRSGINNITRDTVIKNVMEDLADVAYTLDLTSMHLLATALLFDYNVHSKTLSARAFGDGTYFINGVRFDLDQNNEPDYMGHHVNKSERDVLDYLEKYPITTMDNVTSFAFCTDGITSFRRSSFLPEPKVADPVSFMLQAPTSANFLTRMFNLLSKDGHQIHDDLSIISYVQD